MNKNITHSVESFLLKRAQSKTFDEKIAKLSTKTRSNIFSTMRSFDDYCKKNYEDRSSNEIFTELKILKGEDQMQAIREVLQDWIDWLYEKDFLTPSVRQYTSKIRRCFAHQGLRYTTNDFAEPLEFKQKIDEELYELTLEDVQRIFAFCNPKKIGFYLALISTGARPGEILQVRKKDIETTGKRIKIRIEAENVKTKAGRSVYLTKEAGRNLIARLKKLDSDDLVWGTNQNPHYSLKNESSLFNKYTERAGFTEKYHSSKFRKITLYSFRSYFFGRAADVHREGYANRMIGHKGYLPQYDRMSEAKKLDWFLKLESDLLIEDEQRLKSEKEKVEMEKSELQSLKEEMAKYKELWDESERMVTDKEYRNKTLEPLVRNIKDAVKKELRAELLEEIKREE